LESEAAFAIGRLDRLLHGQTSYLSSVKSRVFDSADENAQTVVIHRNFILSSMDIKLRITLKEKWLNFADGVKNLFN